MSAEESEEVKKEWEKDWELTIGRDPESGSRRGESLNASRVVSSIVHRKVTVAIRRVGVFTGRLKD